MEFVYNTFNYIVMDVNVLICFMQGEVEEELKSMAFDNLYIYRPSWVFAVSLFQMLVVESSKASVHDVLYYD